MNYILNVIGYNADPAGALFLLCLGGPAALICLWYFVHKATDHTRQPKPEEVNPNRLQWPFNSQP